MLNRADVLLNWSDLLVYYDLFLGSFLKDSIQMLSKLFIFCVHPFFLVFHTTDSYYLISITFIFILLVLCIPGFSSSGCGFLNLFMIKFKLKVIQ